jgi:hypothetical protein
MNAVHIGLMLVGVVDEDSVNIVHVVPTKMIQYIQGIVYNTSHEKDWLLTLYLFDCFSTLLQMRPVHVALMMGVVVYEDCVKILCFVPAMRLRYVHVVVCDTSHE